MRSAISQCRSPHPHGDGVYTSGAQQIERALGKSRSGRAMSALEAYLGERAPATGERRMTDADIQTPVSGIERWLRLAVSLAAR